MEVCYWALLFTPFLVFHHLLNVHVQLANKKGFKKKKIFTEIIKTWPAAGYLWYNVAFQYFEIAQIWPDFNIWMHTLNSEGAIQDLRSRKAASPWIQCHVVSWKETKVSEQHIASILRITMVCVQCGNPPRSPHVHGQGRNPPLQLALQSSAPCPPQWNSPTPPRTSWLQAFA
jgi:hypothetical protein